MPAQASQAWLSIVPIAEARSSYNGLLVLVFIAASAGLCALAIHRFASRARAPRAGLGLRRARSQPGHPVHRGELRPADPAGVRRRCSSAPASSVDMPAPGDLRPARFAGGRPRPDLGEPLRARSPALVGYRRRPARTGCSSSPSGVYLSLVFLALIGLLAGAGAMELIGAPRHPGRADGRWCWRWRRCSPASCAR